MFIKNDGTDKEQFFFLFLYWSQTLKAVVNIDFNVYEMKKYSLIRNINIQKEEFQIRRYILGLGPINEM